MEKEKVNIEKNVEIPSIEEYFEEQIPESEPFQKDEDEEEEGILYRIKDGLVEAAETIFESAKETVHQATDVIGSMTHNVVEKAEQLSHNIQESALTTKVSEKVEQVEHEITQKIGEVSSRAYLIPEIVIKSAKLAAEEARKKYGSILEKSVEVSSTTKEKISEAGSTVKEKISEAGSALKSNAVDLAHQVVDSVEITKENLMEEGKMSKEKIEDSSEQAKKKLEEAGELMKENENQMNKKLLYETKPKEFIKTYTGDQEGLPSPVFSKSITNK